MKKNLILILFLFGFVSLKAQVDENAKSLELVTKSISAIGLNNDDLKNIIISNTYIDNVSGIRMVYLQQSYCGLPVYNQLQVLAFKNEALVSKSGARIMGLEKLTNGNKGIPTVTANAAVVTALADRKLPSNNSPIIIRTEKNGHFIVFNNMNICRENITAELMWVPTSDGKKVMLAWQVYIIPNTTSDYWMVRVNALDNSIVSINNLTVFCNWDKDSKNKTCKTDLKKTNRNNNSSLFFDFNNLNEKENKVASPTIINNATYRVIPFPAESPSHAGGTAATRVNPWTAAPGNATTLKWHNNGTIDFNYSRGNNVWAQEDRNGDNGTGIPATSTTSVDPLSFDFTPSFTVTPTQTTPVQNQQFNITNLFYWNNVIHDVMYQYGFDEVSGNFQASNIGRGGAENDYVLADAQDGSGTNNANFATPADGSSGRMQMYLWSGNPQKDGDVDNGIVTHEFAHGISNRLTGGPAQAGCLSNDENMGEGWSDYFGLMLTQNWATSTLTTGFSAPRGIGTYAIGQSASSVGIRSQKYCTNFLVNNKVYAPTIPAESHDRGEIWCATLWDMTWNIINQVGSINSTIYDTNGAGGNSIALKLVTLGLKLQPCSPGFIDGRDAILQADQILYGGVHSCAIWEAFRRRGMGAFASQGSSGSVTDQITDFTIGTATLQLTQNITQVPEGQNVTYTNTVSTSNCGGITNFVLTDTLPSNVTYVSGGTYNSTNRVVSFPVTLTASQTQNYVFTVLVNTGAYHPTVSLFQDSANGPTLPSTWTSTTTTTGAWSVSTARSFSPSSSYFSSNLDVQSSQELTLTTPISLGATPPPLSFRHWFNVENTYDGGVLEVSTDGGTTWVDMQSNIILGGYIATMDATTLLAGRRAWSGSSSNKFLRTKVNLAPYANQSIKIRFKFTSDVGTNLEGWYVDDIAIRDQAVVEIQSNLYNSSNVRVVTSDTFTIILPASSSCTSTAISTQPSNINTCAGGTATFNTVASGTNPTYQWQVSNDGGATFTNISGATSASYSINGITFIQNNNKYRVIVSNTCPSTVTSTAALLVVSNPASISTQPVSQILCAGVNTNFSVTAAGSANTYQWQLSTDGGNSFSNISGETNATLNLNNITASMNNNQYHVVISSCSPTSLTSANVTLTVNSQAAITTQPVNTSVCAGSNAIFSASCTGSSLIYQWQISTDGGLTFTDITGQTNSTLTILNISALMDNNKYRVIVNSSTCANIVTSNAAILSVSNNAIINSQPSDLSICSGSNASYSIAATGSGLTYQWQVSTNGGASFSNISGETNASLNLNNVTTSMEGNLYNVIVSSACSSAGVSSNAGILHVLATAQITNQPTNVTTCASSTVTFTASGVGNAVTYQWQVSTDGGTTYTDIARETNSTLSILNVSVAMNNNKYRLVATALNCGSVNSNAATLQVSSPASITNQPVNVSACENSAVAFSVTASGTAISYQWQVSTDGGVSFTNIVGATTSTLNISGVTTSMNNNQYRVIATVTNCGNINSNAVTLTVNNLPIVSINASPSNVIMPGQSITLTASSTPLSNTYNWYNNGVLISGQTSGSIAVNGTGLGIYTASLLDLNGCTNTSASITVKDSILNYTFIYPNPNRGQFQVRFEGVPYNGFSRYITMYDAKGSRVYSKAYSISTSYQIMDVTVKQFSKGVYTLVLSDAIGTTLATGKVVID